MIQFSSKLIEEAVKEISKIPGIGKKSAFRMVLFFLKQDTDYIKNLTQSLSKLRFEIQYCNICHNISDNAVCSICTAINRNKSTICIVENIQDVLAIENTNQYKGVYHVLGGCISPINGIGPENLKIDSLLSRCVRTDVTEIIYALSTTIEGDTTAYYISKKLKGINTKIKISSIARGISVGGELEFTDEITLGRSILNRIPFLK